MRLSEGSTGILEQGPGSFWYRSLSLRLSLSLRMSLSTESESAPEPEPESEPETETESAAEPESESAHEPKSTAGAAVQRAQLRISQWQKINKPTIQLQRRTLRRKKVERRIWGMMREQNWRRKSWFWMKQWKNYKHGD